MHQRNEALTHSWGYNRTDGFQTGVLCWSRRGPAFWWGWWRSGATWHNWLARIGAMAARRAFPARGVYFFREEGEVRSETGGGPRIVRVGTHALKDGSGTKLWRRLSQHRGQASGNGNHRGSIFRLIVGAALIRRDTLPFPTWGKGNSAKANIRDGEVPAPRRRAAPCDPPPSLLANLDDYSCNRAHFRAFSEAGPVSLAPRH